MDFSRAMAGDIARGMSDRLIPTLPLHWRKESITLASQCLDENRRVR
jgi:hypothetical protein